MKRAWICVAKNRDPSESGRWWSPPAGNALPIRLDLFGSVWYTWQQENKIHHSRSVVPERVTWYFGIFLILGTNSLDPIDSNRSFVYQNRGMSYRIREKRRAEWNDGFKIKLGYLGLGTLCMQQQNYRKGERPPAGQSHYTSWVDHQLTVGCSPSTLSTRGGRGETVLWVIFGNVTGHLQTQCRVKFV